MTHIHAVTKKAMGSPTRTDLWFDHGIGSFRFEAETSSKMVTLEDGIVAIGLLVEKPSVALKLWTRRAVEVVVEVMELADLLLGVTGTVPLRICGNA